jgi:hypothetical protein
VINRPAWLENPNGLVTLWDIMKQLNLANVFRFGTACGSAARWFSPLEIQFTEGPEKAAGSKLRDSLTKHYAEMADFCEQFEMPVSKDGCLDIIRLLASKETSKCRWLNSPTEELKQRVEIELKNKLFLWIPSDRARYYEYPKEVKDWDETEKAIDGLIAARFKKASNEILSARRCFSVSQWTASVFHLMRACESGIKALYKTLNISAPKLSDSWGNLLKPMDEQLKKNPTDRFGDWAKQPDFFDHATNDLRAIKRTWRDPTMHIDSTYDESGARKALDAVTSLFVTLSEKLDQDGNVYQSP